MAHRARSVRAGHTWVAGRTAGLDVSGGGSGGLLGGHAGELDAGGDAELPEDVPQRPAAGWRRPGRPPVRGRLWPVRRGPAGPRHPDRRPGRRTRSAAGASPGLGRKRLVQAAPSRSNHGPSPNLPSSSVISLSVACGTPSRRFARSEAGNRTGCSGLKSQQGPDPLRRQVPRVRAVDGQRPGGEVSEAQQGVDGQRLARPAWPGRRGTSSRWSPRNISEGQAPAEGGHQAGPGERHVPARPPRLLAFHPAHPGGPPSALLRISATGVAMGSALNVPATQPRSSCGRRRKNTPSSYSWPPTTRMSYPSLRSSWSIMLAARRKCRLACSSTRSAARRSRP